MSDSICLTVDPRIFALPVVQSALYVLSERIDGRFQVQEDGYIHLTLHALANGLSAAEIERELNAALLAASVNERAFQRAAPIRNYLAQTAFSITTENQQTIEAFAANLTNASEHAGAPSAHVDIQMTDEQADPTPAGNRLSVEQENGRVLLRLDGRKYLLPDVLWAAHELRETCTCAVSHGPPLPLRSGDYSHGQLLVILQPDEATPDLHGLGQCFEHWLGVAAEHWR
jgi:hypothetical protein